MPVDPDLPTDPEIPGEPEDPVINPDPSDPTDPINPGDGDTSDFPKSIYEVDEIDEINYFADEFVQILNDNYFDDIVSLLGKTASIDYVVNDSTTWRVSGSGNTINQIKCSFYYKRNTRKSLNVFNIIFENNTNVVTIVNKPTSVNISLEPIYQIGVGEEDEKNNADLGKTVISTIDPDNTLEGDIWCSYSFGAPGHDEEGYWYYHPVKVYQITEKGVEKFEMTVKQRQYDHEWGVDILINQIKAGLYSSKTQTTEYTFTGMKIEQIPLPEEA